MRALWEYHAEYDPEADGITIYLPVREPWVHTGLTLHRDLRYVEGPWVMVDLAARRTPAFIEIINLRNAMPAASFNLPDEYGPTRVRLLTEIEHGGSETRRLTWWFSEGEEVASETIDSAGNRDHDPRGFPVTGRYWWNADGFLTRLAITGPIDLSGFDQPERSPDASERRGTSARQD